MNTITTRTGGFPVGFRRGGGAWQSDLNAAIGWAIEHGLGVIDLGRKPEEIATVEAAGLRVGSVDLLDWQGLMAPDEGKRKESVAKNAEYVARCGAQNYFVVMLPEEPSRPRKENFALMVESLNELSPALEASGGALAIEGWPGPGALCCTPESYRATFRECASDSIGINYDPSHLVRMGIDPLRFLKEFTARVRHVHGKDAEVLADDLYEYGHEQPATWKMSPAFGASSWRYTIPGQGNSPWGEILRVLQASGYGGAISIELEDRDYNGSDEGEKRGLIAGAQFLSAC
jgi:sugar phosphate isomerase/epimerase